MDISRRTQALLDLATMTGYDNTESSRGDVIGAIIVMQSAFKEMGLKNSEIEGARKELAAFLLGHDVQTFNDLGRRELTALKELFSDPECRADVLNLYEEFLEEQADVAKSKLAGTNVMPGVWSTS